MQEAGLNLLIYLDGLEQGRRQEEQMVSTLVTAGHLSPRYLPGMPAEEAEAEADLPEEDVEYDYSGVQWALPGDLDEDERDELRRVMAEHGTVGVDEPLTEEQIAEADRGEGFGEPGAGYPMDREWL